MKNIKIRVIVFLLFFLLIDIKIIIPEPKNFYIIDGYMGYAWETQKEEIIEIKEENIINKNNLNSYYLIDNPKYLFENILAKKIIAGFFNEKLQSIQVFYEGKETFNILYNFILNQTKKSATHININEDWEGYLWCDENINSYIVLYSSRKEADYTNILSISNKKSVDFELNYNNKIGIPTSVCFLEKQNPY